MREFFKNKQKLAYEKGHADGWNDGFATGTKKAVREAQKVFIKRIEKEIKDNQQHFAPGVLAGLNLAITIIRRDK